jgi:polar amino acid transport system substrate-binding protein
VNAKWCVGASTTYEQWLKGTLEIVDPNMLPVPAGADVTSLPTDNECVQAVTAKRPFDALAANENSLANGVKAGAPLRMLPDVTFTISVAFALDRSGADDSSILPLLNKIVDDMHADGTLTAISMKYLQKDVTVKP